ncbi:helix-turn-helix domain-containing protein [Sinosporangium siamense]|uniref:Transcriptional regulator n=1 Tax=Sinosporangium siamense TaxID=1367973 RepID=A0A919RB36_9ACTN|nr:helix-turn-helix transcriptional regulator [Sinosporangium siamense]GII90628.1 transcriptional regulator [Sinosporangium siamense]
MSSQVQQAREAFGARLRDLRKDARLTGRALASQSGIHFTKVSRIEHGRQSPSEDDVRAWCRACDAENQESDLIATLRGIEGMWLEWQRQLRGSLKRFQEKSFPLYEATARFRVYESDVIPGILQTAEYCTEILKIASRFYVTETDVDEAVEARMERQRYLYRGDRRFVFVIEARTLTTIFGSSDTMLGQLDRLLAVMTLPRVSLGIIPPYALRSLWPGEGFWIFDDRLVKIETTTAGIRVTQPREIATFEKAFSILQGHAVYGPEARELLRVAMLELQHL